MTKSEIAKRESALFSDIEKIAKLDSGTITLLGLRLTDVDMPRLEWERLGQLLGHVHRWGSWALGDWLNFGEAVYGHEAFNAVEGTRVDRYDLAHRVTGLAADTLRNYASICGRIPLKNRRVELAFSTHEPVASLDNDDQVEWLQKAVDNAWGKQELRDAIRGNDGSAGEAEPGGGGTGGEVSVSERIENAARLVFSQAQSTSGGDWVVPDSAMAQLRAALGEEQG